jgi:hypothetical protein
VNVALFPVIVNSGVVLFNSLSVKKIVKKVGHSTFLFAIVNDALFPVIVSSGVILFNSLSVKKKS